MLKCISAFVVPNSGSFIYPSAATSWYKNRVVSFNRLILSVSAGNETSNVFTLSTEGIRSPPRSVASLIFLQDKKEKRILKEIAATAKTRLLFFTNYY